MSTTTQLVANYYKSVLENESIWNEFEKRRLGEKKSKDLQQNNNNSVSTVPGSPPGALDLSEGILFLQRQVADLTDQIHVLRKENDVLQDNYMRDKRQLKDKLDKSKGIIDQLKTKGPINKSKMPLRKHEDISTRTFNDSSSDDEHSDDIFNKKPMKDKINLVLHDDDISKKQRFQEILNSTTPPRNKKKSKYLDKIEMRKENNSKINFNDGEKSLTNTPQKSKNKKNKKRKLSRKRVNTLLDNA